jgi:signal transduction histidine kinase
VRALYVQIYVAFVGILFLFAILMSIAWYTVDVRDGRALDAMTGVAEQLLPPAGHETADLQRAVDSVSRRLGLSLAVSDRERRLLAASGEDLPRPRPATNESHWLHAGGAGLTAALALSDGRWVVVRYRRGRSATGMLVFLLALGGAVALGAYPLVRRLTRRLERLRDRVEALGSGELGARVEVEGRDEVASLAASFNGAADKIERLVEAHKTLLAGASHELRTPLTRIRVAVELAGETIRPEIKRRIEADVAELDELIEELLLASRLDATELVEGQGTVDLLGLVAEEAARYGVEATGAPVELSVEPRLVRRLVKNLLENARRYGEGHPVEVEVLATPPGGCSIRVRDRGPGIPESERERVFEPFYRASIAPQGAGLGLGLSLVRRIARLHGGDARCVAREGGGSVFEVTLKPLR